MNTLFIIKLMTALNICCHVALENAEGENYKIQESQTESGKFKIVKIDSTGRTYVFYAKKKNLIFKILSTKDTINKYDKSIVIGKSYYLKLTSLLKHEPHKLHINGMKYNGTLIKIEPKIIVHDLFESRNINGRYYVSTIDTI